MTVLRKVENLELNQGSLQANGLFNISHSTLGVSFWFDEETKDDLMSMTDEEFKNDAIALINHANSTY
jgi:hypothetical protein